MMHTISGMNECVSESFFGQENKDPANQSYSGRSTASLNGGPQRIDDAQGFPERVIHSLARKIRFLLIQAVGGFDPSTSSRIALPDDFLWAPRL